MRDPVTIEIGWRLLVALAIIAGAYVICYAPDGKDGER